jgi:hypothetical protein
VILVHFRIMRACFLGQNICALGFGVATLQTPPLLRDEETGKPVDQPGTNGALGENGTSLSPPAPPIVHSPCHNSATAV